jgi:hypothetical protein
MRSSLLLKIISVNPTSSSKKAASKTKVYFSLFQPHLSPLKLMHNVINYKQQHKQLNFVCSRCSLVMTKGWTNGKYMIARTNEIETLLICIFYVQHQHQFSLTVFHYLSSLLLSTELVSLCGILENFMRLNSRFSEQQILFTQNLHLQATIYVYVRHAHSTEIHNDYILIYMHEKTTATFLENHIFS